MSTQSWWLIHSPLATLDTPASRFITWAEAFFFFFVMWQLVFNSLHGNGQDKPRACLLQGRCTTSSGPWNLFICVGETLADLVVVVSFISSFTSSQNDVDLIKAFFLNATMYRPGRGKKMKMTIFYFNLFLSKQQMWQMLISNPQPYSIQRPCLQSL